MNITIVIAWSIYDQRGGAERILVQLSDHLINKGHKISVISADKRSGTISYKHHPNLNLLHYGDRPFSFRNNKFFRKLQCFSLNPIEQRALFTIKKKKAATDQLQQILQRIETDVVLAFCPFSAYLTIKAFDKLYDRKGNALAGTLTKTRPHVVTMCHSTPEFSTFGNIFNYLENKKLADGLNFKRVQNQLDEYIKVASRSEAIQVLMPNFVQEAHKIFGNVKIIHIPNPVLQFASPSPLDTTTILNVARIVPLKRQLLLVEAFSLIANEFPDWKVEFWGSTKAKYTQQVYDKIKYFGLQNRVFIKGETDDIDSTLSNASVLVITSRFEGFCLGMLEGMSKGLPVIGCRSCEAVNSIIKEGQNGILCEDTPESLANSLRLLLEDKKLRSVLGKQARIDASIYEANTIFNAWERILLENISATTTTSPSP